MMSNPMSTTNASRNFMVLRTNKNALPNFRPGTVGEFNKDGQIVGFCQRGSMKSVNNDPKTTKATSDDHSRCFSQN